MSAKTPLTAAAARAHIGKLIREDGQPMPESTFREWVRRHQVPHRRFGRTLCFIREELDAWVESKRRGVFV